MREIHKSKREVYLTDIENIMKKTLINENINFVQQYPIRGGLILDFAIPDKKICIETDGEKWHKLDNMRDRKRDYVLKKLGWKVLRFRGEMIKNNVDECIEKIKSKLLGFGML